MVSGVLRVFAPVCRVGGHKQRPLLCKAGPSAQDPENNDKKINTCTKKHQQTPAHHNNASRCYQNSRTAEEDGDGCAAGMSRWELYIPGGMQSRVSARYEPSCTRNPQVVLVPLFSWVKTCARTRHFSMVDFWYSGDFPTNSSPLSESRQASRYFAHAPSCSQKRGTVVLAGFLCSAASVCLFDAGGKGSLDVRNSYESKRKKEEEKQKRNTCSLQMPIRFFFFLILAGCPRRNSIRHKTRDGRKGRQGKVATYLARALTQPFVSRFLILDYKTGRAKRKKKHLKNLRCSGIVVRTGNFLFV